MTKFSTYRPAILFALAGCLSLVCAFQAKAQTGVDPQIYVCTGCTSSPGHEPNVINLGSINVGFDGNHTALSPLLIIVAVPNAGADPTISLPSGVIPIGAGTYYTLATNGGLTGELDGTLTSGQDVYSALSLTNADNSEKFSSLSGFDTGKGITVGTTFNLYVFGIDYALNNGSGGNSPITIDFSGIAPGSFVLGYSCGAAETNPETQCPGTGDNLGDTPFSNAGVNLTVTPEPKSMLLFGTGLLVIGGILRRRRSLKT